MSSHTTTCRSLVEKGASRRSPRRNERDTKEYLNHRGGGTWPGGERGGSRMREKGWEERGPKAHSKSSDVGTPMI